MHGRSFRLRGLSAIWASPRPTACQLYFQSKTQKRTYEDNDGQDADRPEAQFNRHSLNDVRRDKEFQAEKDSSPEAPAHPLKERFRFLFLDQLDYREYHRVQCEAGNNADSERLDDRYAQLSGGFYAFKHASSSGRRLLQVVKSTQTVR